MSVRLLQTEDVNILENYLAPHKVQCMFMCSNLKRSGIVYGKEEPFYGDYYGYFDKTAALSGVLAHYWNGNLMIFASSDLIVEELAVYLKNHATRLIGGILGPNGQTLCSQVLQQFY